MLHEQRPSYTAASQRLTEALLEKMRFLNCVNEIANLTISLQTSTISESFHSQNDRYAQSCNAVNRSPSTPTTIFHGRPTVKKSCEKSSKSSWILKNLKGSL